jgi:CBS domain containing-hemolysin-like protein
MQFGIQLVTTVISSLNISQSLLLCTAQLIPTSLATKSPAESPAAAAALRWSLWPLWPLAKL